MPNAIALRRGGKGIHGQQGRTSALVKIPEYLEQEHIRALMQAARHKRARLLILVQWRAGLRISEALDVQLSDLTLGVERPTLRVRRGKGGRQRLVPVHPELEAGLRSVMEFGDIGRGPIIGVARTTGWRWITEAAERAVSLGGTTPGRHIATHTLRHSFARHLLVHGIPINFVSRWLGHSSLQTTLIYLELVPDPSGSLALVP